MVRGLLLEGRVVEVEVRAQRRLKQRKNRLVIVDLSVVAVVVVLIREKRMCGLAWVVSLVGSSPQSHAAASEDSSKDRWVRLSIQMGSPDWEGYTDRRDVAARLPG